MKVKITRMEEIKSRSRIKLWGTLDGKKFYWNLPKRAYLLIENLVEASREE